MPFSSSKGKDAAHRARARLLAKERRERQARQRKNALAVHASLPKRPKFLTRAAKKALLKAAREKQERRTALILKSVADAKNHPAVTTLPMESNETAMALTPRQKTTALNQDRLRAAGDQKAVAFFESIKANNPVLWKEYEALLNGSTETVGGIKRTDLRTNTKALSTKQFTTAIRQAHAVIDGKDGAYGFFAAQEGPAEAGVATAKAYLGILDELKEHAANGTRPGSQDGPPPQRIAAPPQVAAPPAPIAAKKLSPLLTGRPFNPAGYRE